MKANVTYYLAGSYDHQYSSLYYQEKIRRNIYSSLTYLYGIIGKQGLMCTYFNNTFTHSL